MHGRVSCDSPWFLPDFNGVAVNVLVSFRSRVACWQILLQKSCSEVGVKFSDP